MLSAYGCILFVYILMNDLPGIYLRGPHHPRGDKIIKHHVHYRPTKTGETHLMQDSELLHDKEHLQEHLDEVIDTPDLSQMSDEQLEFYYFQVHDTDRNSKLDGLELLHAVHHISHHEMEHQADDGSKMSLDNNFEYYTDLIDQVLKEDDMDNDGFLSYPEYVAGRKTHIGNNNRDYQPSVRMV